MSISLQKKSVFTGKTNTMVLNITEDQIKTYENGGILLQEAFPNLSRGEREFIKSGVTPKEWDELFGE